MWDEQSFSADSFSADSWLMALVAAGLRLIARMASRLTRRITLTSRL